jgi:hypothetical protein
MQVVILKENREPHFARARLNRIQATGTRGVPARIRRVPDSATSPAPPGTLAQSNWTTQRGLITCDLSLESPITGQPALPI